MSFTRPPAPYHCGEGAGRTPCSFWCAPSAISWPDKRPEPGWPRSKASSGHAALEQHTGEEEAHLLQTSFVGPVLFSQAKWFWRDHYLIYDGASADLDILLSSCLWIRGPFSSPAGMGYIFFDLPFYRSSRAWAGGAQHPPAAFQSGCPAERGCRTASPETQEANVDTRSVTGGLTPIEKKKPQLTFSPSALCLVRHTF